jgi:peptide/nickel transport system substrate-binding protein
MKKFLKQKLLAILLVPAVFLPFAACGSGSAASSSSQTSSAVSAAASSSASAASSTASSGAPKQGGEFVFGLQTQPDHLDPFLATTADTRSILFNIFEGLVKPDSDGNLQPALAESYTVSKDALTYTFKLRSGVKFHNGNEVTPADVKYSLDTQAGLGGGKPLNANLSNIKSVTVSGKDTVAVHLKKADFDFLPYLTAAVVPKGYAEQDTHPIGTGPFEFDSYTPQQSLVLTRNPDYWQKDLPHLDKITFKLESDSNALLLALQGGSVDGASIANNVASQLDTGFAVIPSNSNAVQLLALNNKAKPFDSVLVRQAVSYAVDPEEIISSVCFGKGVRSGTPVIPGLKKYFDDSLTKAYHADTAKAKQLLTEAGYPNGFSFTITVPSNYTVHVDTAQVIVSELKKVGITVQIKQVDFATWLSTVYTNRDYEATIISVDGTALTPRSYLGRYVSTAADDFVNYKSPEYDALYAKAAAEPDEDTRTDLYRQAQELLSKDAASVYIQDISNLNAIKDGVKGFTPYPLYVFDASTLYYTK